MRDPRLRLYASFANELKNAREIAGNGIAPRSDVPADTSDFESSEPAAVGSSGDDIPF